MNKSLQEGWLGQAHSDWKTPKSIIELINISYDNQLHLDPCSNEENNTNAVYWFYPPYMNGLELEWQKDLSKKVFPLYSKVQIKNIYVNPPGGKTKGKSNSAIWWDKCLEQHHKYDLNIIFMCFKVDTLNQNPTMFNNTIICFPRKRIKFDGYGDNPSHHNAIVLLSKDKDIQYNFVEAFKTIGSIVLNVGFVY